MKRFLATLAVLAAGASLSSVPATAATAGTTADTTTAGLGAVTGALGAVPAAPALTRGADPAVVWMSGRTVHTADGQEQTLPLPASHARYLRLLGKRHGSWIVVDHTTATTKVLSIKGHRVRTIWTHQEYDPGTVYVLSEGGDQIVQWFTDRGDRTAAVVFDLRGKRVASGTFGAGVVLDFSGDTLVLGFARKTLTWQPGTPPVQVARGAELADVARDLLFVDDADYAAGPTSLSAPGTPAWSASFAPRTVSPDETLVAGLGGRQLTKLDVRSMTDGAKAAVSGLALSAQPAVAWEPDGSLLATVHSTEGDALVRCSSAGACELASDPVPAGTITFPYQSQYYENY